VSPQVKLIAFVVDKDLKEALMEEGAVEDDS